MFSSGALLFSESLPHLISRFFARYPTPVASENPLEIAIPLGGVHNSQFLSDFGKFLRIILQLGKTEIYIIRI